MFFESVLDEYISADILEQLHMFGRSAFQNINNIINDNITPLFIATAAESLNTYKGVEIIKNSGTIYDLFSSTMMERLELTDAFLAQKIIYAYFDLIIHYRNSNIQITRFKILNVLDVEYHNRFHKVIDNLIDVTILIKDDSNPDRIKFQHDKIEEFFFKRYIEENEHTGLPFFHDIFDLSNRNVIYQGGTLQYLLGMEKRGRLKELKDLINGLFMEHIDMIPKILVEVLSYSENLKHSLSYLLSLDDIEGSKKILSAIIWGIEQSLQDYSAVTYDIKRIVEELQKVPTNIIMSKEAQSYIYFFQSKLEYFSNHYKTALDYTEEARILLGKNNRTLLMKIDIHHAVILMEQGYSKQCIHCLEKDFETYQNSNDLKTKIDLGIELGRAFNHSGQTTRTLELYDILLSHESEISDPYVLARIYEQKANVLNKLMYHKLQYGFVEKEALSDDTLDDIKELFEEALSLYNKSIELLLKANAIFTYSGVLPEKINTYISYSFSIEPKGIDECKQMINELESIFSNISTPFETDSNLSKAYYYEYMNRMDTAENYIKKALDNAMKLQIKNNTTFASNATNTYFKIHLK